MKTFCGYEFKHEYYEVEDHHEIQVSLDPEDPCGGHAFFTEEDLVVMLEELRKSKVLV